jgi:signal transduction histidine kinase/DNA-binding response OmpR family regulator
MSERKVLRILIIDDDMVDAKIISRSIAKTGFYSEIQIVLFAHEAFKIVTEQFFDLIFLDYRLSDSDGLTFLKKIRQQNIETPVIFITSHGDEKIAIESIREGASDYIPKSLLTPDGLSQSIRNTFKSYESAQERKKIELELKTKAKQLSEAQSLAKIGSWELNFEDNTILYSDELAIILEIPHDEILTFNKFKTFVPKEELLEFELNLEKINKEKKFGTFTHQIVGKNGTRKSIKQHVKYFFNENVKNSKILGTMQDVSDQVRGEAELLAAIETAERAVKIKKQFLANMSHEIRTPMNSIWGFTNLLEGSNLNEDQLHDVRAVKKAAENLMALIDDILDLSKIEADRMKFEAIPFSLENVIDDTLNLFKITAQEKKIDLIKTLDSRLHNFLVGDPLKLSQILINLIGNALKFTDQGTINIIVSVIEGTSTMHILKFSVCDTGIGMSAENLESIFENFTQSSDRIVRKYGGTGLGLTISKKLIELQGGNIVVDSELYKGSVFTFTLPFKIINSDKFEGSNVNSESKLSFDFLNKINILLVEDNKMNVVLAKKIFQKWGKIIDVAENGMVALEKIAKNDYDIILMDIQMPEMDGNEATRRLREWSGPKSQVPVIALTAHATTFERQESIEVGMNDFLSKPFHPDDLLNTIHRTLKKISHREGC